MHADAAFGIVNCLLSDGNYLFTYCSNTCTGSPAGPPFGQARLIDEDIAIDFHQETTPDDVVTVIATLPLTRDEKWHKMDANSYLLFHDGECVAK